MTIRRSQGSTLEHGALWFDHKYPADAGYGYVGTSRFRRAEDVYLVGKVRRTDWRSVGGDDRGGEQDRRGIDSESTASDSAFGSEDAGASCSSTGEDQGASIADSSERHDSDDAEAMPQDSDEDQGASISE